MSFLYKEALVVTVNDTYFNTLPIFKIPRTKANAVVFVMA